MQSLHAECAVDGSEGRLVGVRGQRAEKGGVEGVQALGAISRGPAAQNTLVQHSNV